MPKQNSLTDVDPLDAAQAASSPQRELLSVLVMRQAIKDALPPNDPLNEYADFALPHLAAQFVLATAKGGAFVEKQRAQGKAESELARYDRDQSLLSHILNGLLPVARIIRYLQAHKAPQFRRFDEQAYRLFCIGYTLHDIDKVPAVKARMDSDKLTLAANKQRFLALLDEQMQALGLDKFFNPSDPEAYRAHLADIAFIIANTQEVWGTYRQTFDLDVQTDLKLLWRLCDLTQLADHLAYLTPSPRDTASDQTHHKILDNLSDHSAQFVYHAVAENRGILTNIINSAAIAQMAKDEHCLPLLFAPNGVVYLAPAESYTPPTVETIAEIAIEKLKAVCRKQVESSLVGFGLDRLKRNLKEAEFYKLLFSQSERLRLGIRAVEKRGRAQAFSTVLGKLPEGVTFPDTTTRREADMLAKFGHYATHILGESQHEAEETVLRVFNLSSETQLQEIERLETLRAMRTDESESWSETNLQELESLGHKVELKYRREIQAVSQIDSSGGTIYRWYRAAAAYLEMNPGLSAEDGSLQGDLENRADQLTALVSEDSSIDKWVWLKRYVCDVTTVGWHAHQTPDNLKSPYIFDEKGAAEPHDFNKELVAYTSAKENGKATCSLCALPYDVQEQAETGVLFGPQVYTGRQLLHGGKLKRNICAVCRVEQLLRMVLMQNVDVQGKDFEDKRKVRYLYIYPSYFFTTETLLFARRMVSYLKGFKFTDAQKQLIPQGAHAVEWGQTAYQQLQELLLRPPSVLTDALDEINEDEDEEAEEATDEKKESKYILPAYPDDEPLTFLFFGIPHRKPPKRDVTDTETWVAPAFLGLVLSMVLDAKVVVSASPVPLFVSGADFPETVILDAPNPFAQSVLAPSRASSHESMNNDHAVASEHIAINFPRFRLDDILPSLQTITAAYAIHLDAHADTSSKDYYRWGEFSKVSAQLATSPLYAFHYLERAHDRQTKDIKEEGIKIAIKQRMSQLYIQYVEQFLKGGKQAMSIPRELTEKYRAFYRAKSYKSNSILKPIADAADVLLDADKRIFDDDGLKETIVGALSALMERVHKKQAEGWPNLELRNIGSDGKPHFDKNSYAAERANIIAFADYFVRYLFGEVLRHDRAALAGRQLNLLKNACEAVYLMIEAEKRTPPVADDDIEDEIESENS
jgi:CRISPR-associated protein Csc3